MTEEEVHPCVGDTLKVTGIVHDNRCISGLPLPAGFEFQNSDQRFDEYFVEVLEIDDITTMTGDISKQELTLLTEDGDRVTVYYRGREPIAGRKGMSISASNSMNAHQAWNWERAE
jgi:hypothetical protein